MSQQQIEAAKSELRGMKTLGAILAHWDSICFAAERSSIDDNRSKALNREFLEKSSEIRRRDQAIIGQGNLLLQLADAVDAAVADAQKTKLGLAEAEEQLTQLETQVQKQSESVRDLFSSWKTQLVDNAPSRTVTPAASIGDVSQGGFRRVSNNQQQQQSALLLLDQHANPNKARHESYVEVQRLYTRVASLEKEVSKMIVQHNSNVMSRKDDLHDVVRILDCQTSALREIWCEADAVTGKVHDLVGIEF